MSGGYGGDAMSGGDHDPRARSGLRGFYLIAGSALAIGATAALILTDNPRLLKVAVIVAVWACVLALLAGARPARHDDEELTSEREAELRHTFELELDREVAARREYELRLEVAMRRELESTLRQDIGELRSQLGTLRKELTDRWNGELRLERFALRAESTRLSGSERQMLEHEAQRLSLEGGSTPDGGFLNGVAQIEHGTSTYRAIRTTTVGGAMTTEASTEHHEYVSGESPVAAREIGPARAPREVEAGRAREIEAGPAGRARGQERPPSGRPPSGRGGRGEAVESASGRYPSPFATGSSPAGESGSGGAARPAAGAEGRSASADPLFGPLPAGSGADGGPDRSAWNPTPARDEAPSGRWPQYGELSGSDNSWNGAGAESQPRRRRRSADDDDRPAADARRTNESSAWGPTGFRVNGLDHLNGSSIPLPSNGVAPAGNGIVSGGIAPGGNDIAAGGASPIGPASGKTPQATGATPSWGSEPAPSNPASANPASSGSASSGPAGGWAGLAERDASGRHGRSEPYGDDSATMRRRRRYREDNDENDVLTRMRQQR